MGLVFLSGKVGKGRPIAQLAYPSGTMAWIRAKGLSRVFSSTTVQKHQFFCAQLRLEFPRETGLILRFAVKVGNPLRTKQGNRPTGRDQKGRRGSNELVPGTSVVPSSETGMSPGGQSERWRGKQLGCCRQGGHHWRSSGEDGVTAGAGSRDTRHLSGREGAGSPPGRAGVPGESQGQQGLAGCRLWGCTESDMTEAT